MSVSSEDYIKQLFKIQQTNGGCIVKTSQLSDGLGIQPASVSDMLKRLHQDDLVVYEPYKGALLTAKGESMAKMIVRRHRLTELFLVQTLNLSWDEVHEEAEVLEHVVSEKVINAIDTFLNFPKYDPHGESIPQPDGSIPEQKKSVLLSELAPGDCAQITRIICDKKSFLQYLNTIGCVIGESVVCGKTYLFDKSMDVTIASDPVHLSPFTTAHIMVSKFNHTIKEKVAV